MFLSAEDFSPLLETVVMAVGKESTIPVQRQPNKKEGYDFGGPFVNPILSFPLFEADMRVA